MEMPASETGFLDFDPFGMRFRQTPHLFHSDLIAASPGFILMEGVPSAFVASYRQVTAVMRNFKAFSSLKPKGLPGMERIDFFNGLPVMNYSNPPDHTRRRKVVNPAFTPARTEMLNEKAAILIDNVLEEIAARGSFEAMSDLTKKLSIDTLLTRFLGVADADQHIFMNYVSTLPLLDKMKAGDAKPQPYLDAWAEGARYCRAQQELARSGACKTLIGVIANGADGGAISDDEMMAMMIVLLIGGVSTVAGAAASSLMYLATNPEVAARIRVQPELASSHLEESLRMDPPVSLVMRFAGPGAEIEGVPITQGTPVYVMIAVGCHDPAKFADPYRFNIDRPNLKDHLAFGHGMHTCIGNAITRNIVPLLIQKMVRRFPNLALSRQENAVEYDISTPRARHIKRLVLTV
jgi:cytochrome P450